MEIQGNSIVDTVIEYASMKFGVEMSAEQVSKQLKELEFSDTLALVDAIKNEDDNAFSDVVDLSIEEGYGTSNTASPSRATIRAQGTKDATAMRRANNAEQDAARDSKVTTRTVAGAANKTPTGTPTRPAPDLDGQQRDANTEQTADNASEIERLKQLAFGKKQ